MLFQKKSNLHAVGSSIMPSRVIGAETTSAENKVHANCEIGCRLIPSPNPQQALESWAVA